MLRFCSIQQYNLLDRMLRLDANITLKKGYVFFISCIVIYQNGDQYLPSIHSWYSGGCYICHCFQKKKFSSSRCFNCFKSMLLLLSLSFSLLLAFYYFFYLLIFLFFFFFFLLLVLLFFCFWLNGSFSHMKWLRLVDYFVCLFVCSVSWAVIIVGYCRVTIHNLVASTNSSPVPRRFTIFLIDFYFNITLHFILNFSLFFCHSLDYEFTLTDFMAVTSEHDVFVAP